MSNRGRVTNLALQSEAVSTSPWSLNNVTSAAFAGPFPTGVSAMQTLTDSNPGGGNIGHNSRQTLSATPGEILASAYVKPVAGSGWIVLTDIRGAILYFNLNTGVLGTATSCDGGVVAVENSCFRVWMRTKNSVGDFTQLRLGLAGGDLLASYTANGTAVAFGGIQIETLYGGQTTPNKYIATGASTANGWRDYRQNGFKYSEDFTQAAWVKSNCTVTSSTLTATSTVAQVTQSPTLTGGTRSTLSFKVLKGQSFTIKGDDSVANGVGVTFDGATGAYVGPSSAGTTWAATSYSCVSAGAYWYATISFSHPPLASNASFSLVLNKNKVLTWGWANACSVSDTITATAAQLTQSTSPSDYVATTSAPYNPSGAPRALIL